MEHEEKFRSFSVEDQTGILVQQVIEAERMDRALKEKHKEIAAMEAIVVQNMVEKNIDKIEIRGITFKPMDDLEFSMDQKLIQEKSWDNPTFFDFLEEIGESDIIQTKRTVPWQTRNKELKELYEKGEVQLPNWINIKPWTKLKYSKAAVQRLADGQ